MLLRSQLLARSGQHVDRDPHHDRRPPGGFDGRFVLSRYESEVARWCTGCHEGCCFRSRSHPAAVRLRQVGCCPPVGVAPRGRVGLPISIIIMRPVSPRGAKVLRTRRASTGAVRSASTGRDAAALPDLAQPDRVTRSSGAGMRSCAVARARPNRQRCRSAATHLFAVRDRLQSRAGVHTCRYKALIFTRRDDDVGAAPAAQ